MSIRARVNEKVPLDVANPSQQLAARDSACLTSNGKLGMYVTCAKYQPLASFSLHWFRIR